MTIKQVKKGVLVLKKMKYFFSNSKKVAGYALKRNF